MIRKNNKNCILQFAKLNIENSIQSFLEIISSTNNLIKLKCIEILNFRFNSLPLYLANLLNKNYIYSLVMLMIPFTSSYLLIINHYQEHWQVNYILSIFILAILAGWQNFLYFLFAGLGLAILCYKINYYGLPRFSNLNIATLLLFSSLYIVKIILFKNSNNNKFKSLFLSDYINKSLNKVINKKSNDLVQALSNKEIWISNIVNEFHEPISSVKQILHELMVNWDNLKIKDKTKYLARIYQDIHKLYDNINNISSISNQNTNLIISPINFKELINKLLYNGENKFFFNQKNIIFRIFYDEKVPNCFMGDKQKLNQAITLLLDNAIKFSYNDTEVIIKVELEEEKFIKFSIENEGIGIPNGEEKLVFQSFVQSTKTSNDYHGKGLGLTIARNIIQAHNGIIWIDKNSTDTKNTKICFIIPINHTSNTNNISPQREIICIDDDLTVINNYKLLLNYGNYKNVYFTSPQKALDYINKNFYKIDIILLDLMMPEMHGFEFLSQLRLFNKTKNIPVVINSCISDENDINKSFDLGANDYIQKPFSSKKLYFVLNNYLVLENKEKKI